jgi:hypothetical protein
MSDFSPIEIRYGPLRVLNQRNFLRLMFFLISAWLGEYYFMAVLFRVLITSFHIEGIFFSFGLYALPTPSFNLLIGVSWATNYISGSYNDWMSLFIALFSGIFYLFLEFVKNHIINRVNGGKSTTG